MVARAGHGMSVFLGRFAESQLLREQACDVVISHRFERVGFRLHGTFAILGHGSRSAGVIDEGLDRPIVPDEDIFKRPAEPGSELRREFQTDQRRHPIFEERVIAGDRGAIDFEIGR